MMKKFNFIGILLLGGVLLLSGCGNAKNDSDKAANNDVVINKEAENGGSIERGQGYGFTQFDLSIDVDGQDAVEAEYDVENEQVEADYENTLKKVRLEDKEAIDELHLLFMDIRLTSDTTQEEAIERILEWLEIDSYTKFELEVDFDDKTRLDFEDRK